MSCKLSGFLEAGKVKRRVGKHTRRKTTGIRETKPHRRHRRHTRKPTVSGNKIYFPNGDYYIGNIAN
jgi:hypothetical protein